MAALTLAMTLLMCHSAVGQNAVPSIRRDIATQTLSADAPMTPVGPEGMVAPMANGVGSEFGEQWIVQRRAHVEPWSASGDLQVLHTDNAALTPVNEQEDWYLRYGVSVSYTNRVKGPLFLDVSVQQFFFRYGEFDILDFDFLRFQGGALLQAPWLFDAFFFARYHLQRITESGLGSTLFTSHSAEIGLQKVWRVRRGQQVFAALSADLALGADPKASERNEYSLTLGYSARLTQRVSAGLTYRGARYEYGQGGRSDWNHNISLGVTFDATDWLRLAVNAGYSHNESNSVFADYDNFTPGGSVALRLSF